MEIIVATESTGAGVIVRYRSEGREHIYAYVGADSLEEAHRYAVEGARDKGAEGKPEVVARWNDR